VKKGILLGLPLVLILPLLLLVLGLGNANIEAARAACATSGAGSGSFGIGTLNWRGASHHTKNPHPGERPYSVRVPNMVSKIGASGASIIGFQEFEPPQAQAFLDATDPAWEIVAGKRHGHRSTADAIAYQPGAWQVDEVRYVSIRYGGPMIQVPLVRFTSTGSLGSVWVLNTHNPANAVGGTNATRDAAVRAEAHPLRQLQASEPDTALFLTGDMNDKARFRRLFLSVAGQGWSSANPDDGQIDWIMGGPGVSFSGTVVDQSANDRAHNYTDHPFVHTTAHLSGAAAPPSPQNAGPGAGGRATAGDPEGQGGQVGSGLQLGVLPTVRNAQPGQPVNGNVTMATANLPQSRIGGRGGAIRTIASHRPDFIALNEVSSWSAARLAGAVRGYGAYKDPVKGRGADQNSLGNAVLWHSSRWHLLDGGRFEYVEHDLVVKGRPVDGSRYATWAVLRRASDGAQVVVIATHHMTNPEKQRKTHGNYRWPARVAQYADGMRRLRQLVVRLAGYGPVLMAGDMNVHPAQGDWSAPDQMARNGFGFTFDGAASYQFHPHGTRVVSRRLVGIDSDHPHALVTSIDLDGVGTNATTTTPPRRPDDTLPGGTRPAGCPPCPTLWSGLSVALPNATATGSLREARVAAAAAYQAGFRGEDLVTAVAIARVESTWNPRATTGSHHGLWQIAGSHRGRVPGWNTPDDIFDPLLNAKFAYALYQARPGSGEARFADWIPFQRDDYRKYLDIARQAVATTAGTAEISNVSAAGCEASPMTVAGELSADVSARVDAMVTTPEGLCALSWTRGAPCTYDNQCPKVVDAVYGGPGVGRGYGNGQDVAQGIINAGLAQAHGTGLDPLPPVGAVVSYNTGNGVGHVAIYVGNGKIFGNDYGCSAKGVYGCVGFADVGAPGGPVTWALPKRAFDMGGMPSTAA
jgi:endonuclease/exonuclease/phosphatase family metal-dependent hydrolase